MSPFPINLVTVDSLAAQPEATAQDSPLPALLAAIPIAEDGHVVHKGYHNATRAALLALASEVSVGRGPIAPLSPALVPVQGITPWTMAPGVAIVDAPTAGNVTAAGWMPVELPHGGVIDSFAVSGVRTGPMVSFLILLVRQALTADPSPKLDTLAQLECSKAPSAFLESTAVTAPAVNGPTAGLLKDYRTIDNTKFKYFLRADVARATEGARAQINSIQIVVERIS